MLQFMKHIIVN